MMWNWKHKNWPNFKFDFEELEGFEQDFIHKSGLFLGSLKHVDSDGQSSLLVDLMSNEAYKTSEIEGELLNRDSLQSSIRKCFGLKTDYRRIPPAEQGIAEMMVNLYKTYHEPMSHGQLFDWHKMLTNGRRDLQEIGSYRSHKDPMQIVSGAIAHPTVHFEAPPSVKVPQEMNAFVHWFNQSAGTKSRLKALSRAGIAHIYFESIHPFEDGNGRIGRAVAEKSLSQNLGRPTLIALSNSIESHKKQYYEALQANSKDLEITDWLRYFCRMVLDAQDYTQSMLDFLIEKGKFYHRFEKQLNSRQQKVAGRMFQEGINGFKGGLSAENYMSITGAPPSTATRDLQKMVELSAFLRIGERKGTRYFLNINHASAIPKNS